jgi:hypothetical protein
MASTPCWRRPSRNVVHTDEKLCLARILRLRGIASHGGYWAEPDDGGCLDVVLEMVVPDG